MKHILITGACGFIGGHFIEEILEGTDWSITALCGLTYAGNADRLLKLAAWNPDRCRIFFHDLRAPINEELTKEIGSHDYIVNIASNSHVDRSIDHPAEFIQGNVAVVVNMLEFAKNTGCDKFIQISTDEVYGAAPDGYSHKEWDAICPSNPYSASKAAQEAIAISYWRTYGVPVMITNTMNNFGERQHEEKFIGKIIKAARTGEALQIHGEWIGENKWRSGSRVWLHARQHGNALRWLLNNIQPSMFAGGAARPDRFNIAGDKEIQNSEMVELISEILGVKIPWQKSDFHSSRAGHDLRYSLSNQKLDKAGWKPTLSFEESLSLTVKRLANT
jgi:dTDP-glucose 4,6-dehydratase